MKIKTWLLSVIGVAILVGLSWWVIHLYKELRRTERIATWTEGEVSTYKIKVDSLREVVYESGVLLAAKERDLVLTKEQERRVREMHIRDVKIIGELRLSLKAYQDSLLIKKGVDTIKVVEYITEDGVGLAVPVGTSWSWADEWARSYAGIDSAGLGYSGFIVKPFGINLVVGSRGVFSKQYVSSVSTANPYVTIDRNSMQLVQKKKAQPFLIGLGAGIVATAALFLAF